MAEKDIKVVNVINNIQAQVGIGADELVKETPLNVGRIDFYKVVRDATLPNNAEQKTRL